MTRFHGVFSTPMTPFGEDGRLALDLIDPYLEWQSENGVKGVYVLGTWGGFALLDLDERRKAAEAYCAAARRHKLKILVHIGTHSMSDTLDLARHAEDNGADAISSVVPQYYSTAAYLELDDYKRYFGQIINATKAPLYLYNNPRTTAVLLSPAEFVGLCDVGVAGVKDGSKSLAWIMQTQDALAEARLSAEIIPGNTLALVYGRLYGCTAMTSGAAVVFPDETAKIHALIDAGDIAGAVRQHCRVLALRSALGLCSAPPAAAHVLLRKMDRHLGWCRSPWPPVDSELLRRIEDRIASVQAGRGIHVDEQEPPLIATAAR